MFLVSEMGHPRLIRSQIGSFFAQVRSEFVIGSPTFARVANFSNITEQSIETRIIGGCVVGRNWLGETPRLLTFVLSWRALVVVTSRPVPFVLEYETDEKEIEPEHGLQPHYQKTPTPDRPIEPDGLPSRTEEKYQGYVLSESGRLTPVLEFERHEKCTAIAFVRTLDDYRSENSTFSEYLAVGSAFMCHEERQMRGRLSIFKGQLVYNEERQEAEYDLHSLYRKNQQGAVTAIGEVDGYLAVFIGGRLQMNMFVNQQYMKEASFLNGHFYCAQLLSLKNYLFFVDAFRGFQLVRWRLYGNKLITMACDFATHLPLSAALLTDGGAFGGVVFDDFGNAQVFEIDEYAIPADAFVIRSVFHVGCRVTASGHFPIKAADQDRIAGHFAWFVSDRGRVGLFSPVRGDTNRRHLCFKQNASEKVLVGLSHLEYRSAKFWMLRNQELILASPRLVMDMDLIRDLLDSAPEHLRQCIRALGRSMADVLGVITDVFAPDAIFE
jgi:hypothetical protein